MRNRALSAERPNLNEFDRDPFGLQTTLLYIGVSRLLRAEESLAPAGYEPVSLGLVKVKT
jgi:hypothetical protein